MIYIFLILFFSFLILNQLFNTTIEGMSAVEKLNKAAAKKAEEDAKIDAKKSKGRSDLEAKQATNLKEECAKLSNVNCANLVSEENKGIISRMQEIAKAINDGASKSKEAQKKNEAQVKIDTYRKAKIKAATSGENVVNSPLMDKAITQSKVPK